MSLNSRAYRWLCRCYHVVVQRSRSRNRAAVLGRYPQRPFRGLERLESRTLLSASLLGDLDEVPEPDDGAAVVVDISPQPAPDAGTAEPLPTAYMPPVVDGSIKLADDPVDFLSLDLAFEANEGQSDDAVDFLARGSGYNILLSDADAVLTFGSGEDLTSLRLDVVGADTSADAQGQDLLGGVSNYLIGNDPDDWVTGVEHVGRVVYEDVYAGIDLHYYGNQRRLEYDFVVDAGVATETIRLSFDGAEDVLIDESGGLLITMPGAADPVRFMAPYSYQEIDGGRQIVESRYIIHEDGTIGFEMGDYDATATLVIDPILDYSTFLGGTGNETAFSITEDGAGDVYVLGNTHSADFPATTGSLSGTSDIYVAKFSPDGAGAADLIYATYIGGTSTEFGSGSIHVNGSGEAIFLGSSSSSDFPTTAGAYDTSLGGSSDAVIGKLNAAGTTLLYSTYYGGNAGSEGAGALAVDAAGDVYITGQTLSNNLPTVNAYDSSYTGSSDIYVARFTLAGGGASDLLYSTYLGGGTDFERSNGIDVDAANKVYVTGPAFSGHPTTAGAFQTTMEGSSDAFLSVLDTTISGSGGLVYSTLIGGAGSDEGNAVHYRATDGYVYIGGQTSSADFDSTTGAYMEASGGGWDGFLAIIDPAGGGASDLIYGSYLGGTANDFVDGLDIDASGFAYLTGRTAGSFPTVNPTQGTYGGGTYDAFVATLRPLSAGATDLTFSTYLGDTGTDYGHDVVVNGDGEFYVTGYTGSGSFPTTSGAYDETANGGNDAFVARFGPQTLIVDTNLDVNDGDTSSISALLSNKGTDGFISLREAIIATNNTAGRDEIVLSTGTYTLTIDGDGEANAATGDLDVSDDLTITGAGVGTTILDANLLERLFDIVSGTVSIAGLAIQDGLLTGPESGGAIKVQSGSDLTLSDVVVRNSQVDVGRGGGILVAGTLTLVDVAVEGNSTTSGTGGGIRITNTGSATLTGVTISGNSIGASSSGGGIYY
ncbi:MAG: hypothetical protein OER86_08300, partial [Phycisphaerae bacterium]|nr:hypothetical protein [Phycisphaerae bacterium]